MSGLDRVTGFGFVNINTNSTGDTTLVDLSTYFDTSVVDITKISLHVYNFLIVPKGIVDVTFKSGTNNVCGPLSMAADGKRNS